MKNYVHVTSTPPSEPSVRPPSFCSDRRRCTCTSHIIGSIGGSMRAIHPATSHPQHAPTTITRTTTGSGRQRRSSLCSPASPPSQSKNSRPAGSSLDRYVSNRRRILADVLAAAPCLPACRCAPSRSRRSKGRRQLQQMQLRQQREQQGGTRRQQQHHQQQHQHQHQHQQQQRRRRGRRRGRRRRGLRRRRRCTRRQIRRRVWSCAPAPKSTPGRSTLPGPPFSWCVVCGAVVDASHVTH